MTDPTSEVQGFADKVNNATGSLGFLAYLLDTKQPSFEKYNGTYPSGLRENMTGLMEMASMLGMGDNIAEMLAPNIAEIADEMTPEKIMTLLDGLTESQFNEIYANETMQGIISDIAAPILERKMAELKLSDALTAAGMTSINLDAFEYEGQKLTDQNFMTLEKGSIRDFSSGMSDAQTLAFLDSLPDDRKATFLEELAAERDENDEIKRDEDGQIIPITDAEGNPVSFAGLSIEDAIEERAKVGLAADSVMGKFNAVTGFIGAGSDHGLDSAREEVYAEIKAAIPGSFMAIIDEQKNNRPTPSAEDMFKALTESLADRKENGGRQEILASITANMDTEGGIRSQIKAIKDAKFLMQFLPQEMMDAQIAEGIRGFLQENGFLRPIIAAFQSFLPFIGTMLRGFGLDGVADKLENALDIDRMQQDGLSREVNDAAAGVVAPTEPPTPEPEGTVTVTQQGPGTPATIVN